MSGTIDFKVFKTLMIAKVGDRKNRLKLAFSAFDENSLKETYYIVAQNHIADLEEAVTRGEVLQETYYFEHDFVDKAPLFTPEKEEFAQTGMFTQID
ncbi:MAG: hypothetical protein V7K69_08790 [Nostoc sp.]